MATSHEDLRDLITRRFAGGSASAPSELAAHLEHRCSFSRGHADALAWGELVELTADEVDMLSVEFGLHRELLGTLTTPTSVENAAETAHRAILDCLSPEDCALCAELAADMDMWSGAPEELDQLALRMLAHLQPAGRPETAVSLPGGFDELADVLSSLDEEARERVLRYAYHELTLADQGRSLSGF